VSAVLQQRPAARILDVTEDEYFADPCEVPSLSQSTARTLLTQSPLHAWTAHPKLNPQPTIIEEPSAARDEGSVLHALLIGKGAAIDVIKADNYRTNAAKSLRDAARLAGRLPVLEHRYDEILEAAGHVRKNFADYGIVFGEECEFAVEWTEDGVQGPVICRGRPDNLHRGYSLDDLQFEHTLWDLKKIKSADDETCMRHIYEYGYDIQRAAYVSGVSKLLGCSPNAIDFVFVFAEIEPPYAVNPIRLDDSYIVMGERRWARAIGLWEHCLVNDYWPSYTKKIHTLEAPAWAIAKEERLNGSF
jgi:hypothetical protein